MRSWQEELLKITESTDSEQEVFRRIELAACAMGFEHCAYGLRVPWPLSNPRILMVNNYSPVWQKRYAQEGYLLIDPTVSHGRKSQKPLVWTEDVFAGSRQFWEDARAHGLSVGWAQSSLDANGIGGMLSLARSHDSLTTKELDAKENQMRWLVNIAHLALSRVLIEKVTHAQDIGLTRREVEVLKWTADGKSAQEIADILNVTKHVVDFHIKNAIYKLKTANKTAAVVKAAMLGLLN